MKQLFVETLTAIGLIAALVGQTRADEGSGQARRSAAAAQSLNTRFSRCAQLMAVRRSAGVGGSSDALILFPLPRLAGVIRARC